MIVGLKSLAALGTATVLVAIAVVRGVLDASYLQHLSGAAAFAVGLVASAGLGLVAAAWRPDVPSRSALEVRGRQVLIVDLAATDGTIHARELPGTVQRALLLASFTAVALGALTNHAAARIAELRDRWSEPSPSTYCLPAAPKPKSAEPEPSPPEVVEQQGCALVRRAYALGYAKSLGTCAPKTVAAAVLPKPTVAKEVCTRRELDEPFLHYGFRRVARAVTGATETSPIEVAEHRVDAIRTHVDYLESLVADIRHAITGTPHAAHHIWTNLPDPHPPRLRERFVGAPRCSQRFASLPLWPHWSTDQQSELFEHVLGQLLFATRFGSTASCNDYVIHWNAAADACAHPDTLLADKGLRDVIDRRRRQLDLVALAKALGRDPPPAPPPVSAVISMSCFVVGGAIPTGQPLPRIDASSVTVDGDPVAVRSIHVAAIRTDGDGPIDVYQQLAMLLGGDAPLGTPSIDTLTPSTTPPGPTSPTSPTSPTGDDYLLARLDALASTDPFASRAARAQLARDELADVYPIERHLHAFVDAFRRRYLAQRGRL